MGPATAFRAATTRRDDRHKVPAGSGSVEFGSIGPGGTRQRGNVTEVSAVGLTFVTYTDSGLAAGVILPGATLRLGGSIVEGDIRLVNLRPVGPSSVVVGCLFYPSAGQAEESWGSLIAGMEGRRPAETGSKDGASLFQMRCSACHRALHVHEPPRTWDLPLVVRCWGCSESHSLDLGKGKSRLEAIRLGARDLARKTGIDLAGAYSVQLGAMTLDQVGDMCASQAAPGAPEAAHLALTDLDAVFARDQARGPGKAEEASAPRRREAVAYRLITRHGLSRPHALAVADRRLSLLEAVRLEGREGHVEALPHRRSARSGLRRITMVVVLLLGLAGAVRGLREPDRGAEGGGAGAAERPRAWDLASTSVLRDAQNRVTEVRGPDPGSVLAAFCSGYRGAVRREPLAIVMPAPAEPGVRVGVFAERDARYTIRILRKGGLHVWVAGGGDEPIPIVEAPHISPGTPQFSIR